MPLPRSRAAGLHAARRGARGQRGSLSLEMVVVMPVLLLVMFVGVQAALVYQARTVCQGAAQSGARAAAAENGSAGAGIATARAALDASGAGLGGAQVAGQRSAAEATISVRATIQSLVPGWEPVMAQSATMPVERITG